MGEGGKVASLFLVGFNLSALNVVEGALLQNIISANCSHQAEKLNDNRRSSKLFLSLR